MLIQGYTVDIPNIFMLPYINVENYKKLLEKLGKIVPHVDNNLSVPLVRAAMTDKKKNAQITAILNDVMGERATSEILKTVRDLPIIRVRTTVRNMQNNEEIPIKIEQNFISLRTLPDIQCMFELNILREGSSKMNVYSKKFNKQKEEFWFLIFVEGDQMSFRKFSFSRKIKKIDIPLQMPATKGRDCDQCDHNELAT